MTPEREAEIRKNVAENEHGDDGVDLVEELDSLRARLGEVERERDAVKAERDEARQWVRDLHSGMYVNCVYCGHRYGQKDKTPDSMADILKAHVEKCPKHPLSAALGQLAEARAAAGAMRNALNSLARSRQFGACWCSTAAGIYCVGQPECKAAQAALRSDAGAREAAWKNGAKKFLALMENYILHPDLRQIWAALLADRIAADGGVEAEP